MAYVILAFDQQEVVLQNHTESQQPEEERRKTRKLQKTGELYETYTSLRDEHAFPLQSFVYVFTDMSCCEHALPHADSAENKAPVQRGGLTLAQSDAWGLRVVTLHHPSYMSSTEQ